MRSLCWGKEVLEKGLRWRVGDGTLIRIYKDKWIPRQSTFKILSQPLLGSEATVEQILSPSGGWNDALIAQSFTKDDVEAIQSIPIGSRSCGFFKVNCDAAIDVSEGRIGFGLVIRDSTGVVMASSSQVMAVYFNAQAAEAIAILRGIQFSKECGLYPCYIEYDAEVVVMWINESNHLDSMCGAILADIIFISTEMIDMSFNYVHRQAN
ncbi:hypothetical protein Dsin_011191 [Dipteronia sinensis]|uniref:RNase H type-1 domain-containing protein n=1 Tax=Dipteronia sinensis TaxID=43782 RepID=A0AAE0EDD4_9ROSI|nr:hypothetical protein Dsin_011191 [Dipteronia sinensis]